MTDMMDVSGMHDMDVPVRKAAHPQHCSALGLLWLPEARAWWEDRPQVASWWQ